MLQYLLNTTAIWLISLLLFDVFLRRENYHGYNRFYLLFTFLLGIFLPLVQWQEDGRLLTQTLQQPMERVIAAKQNIVAATTPTASVGWQQWLAVIYVAGVLVALCLLVIEVIKLVSCYRSRKKSYDGRWAIIETGKDHAPFSFLNKLFVCSKEQYSVDEWNMILVHEYRHSALLHFADLLLMQIARIIFWFHPLVYVYNKRLLLVHEFQADSIAAGQAQAYGTFLIEQAVLRAAPSISHSFNRSPIKNRIVMLTRKSSAASRIKMLVFIPLALVCVVCFSKNSFSQRFIKNGNFVTYKGNRFELFTNPVIDTQTLTNPITGEQVTKYIKHDPVPVKMNGNPIPADVDKQPYFTGSEKNLRYYLLKKLKNELSKFDEGRYVLDIRNVLVDEHGKIVYFDYADIRRYKTNDEIQRDANKKATGAQPSNSGTISKTQQEEIFKKVCRLMDAAPPYIPAKVGDKNVVAPIPDQTTFWNNFEIKDHRLYDQGKRI